ncbi:hypothetical protein BT96DRAFT_947637 [Gymnopus androsaceus JB14]|uniref:Uncharacterized protein n=1 Tax=Gymnopus androsaceus JB14 TaxID=1447944 RepID=A0A6A4GRV7_9AGAR|nr:hypothetical protein BT96DRAFT_947637 [Gymnopus androsaceus JB14]
MTQTDIQGFTPSQIYAVVEYMEQGAPPSTPIGTASLTNNPPIHLAPASQATTSPSQAATMPTPLVMASFNTPPSITCSSCGTVNHIPNSDVHYVVTVRKSVGVFSDLAIQAKQQPCKLISKRQCKE